MEKILPVNYSLYDATYGSDFPIEQLYILLFDKIPSKFCNNEFYHKSIVDYLSNEGFILDSKISTVKRKEHYVKLLYINKKKNIIVEVLTASSDERDSELVQLSTYYNISYGELETQLSFNDLLTYKKKKKKANINLVKSEMGHLDIEEYDLEIPNTDLELNYGSEFLKIHELISYRLNKNNDKGIILLHGDPGTGKTSYIKYLTGIVKEKNILFIPPSMAEVLSEPSIIPFLMEHKNSILIIEDAERVISDREINGSAAGVSNILNLTDGILGDCLNIQIIATFNMKREKIDSALLRKGRLIVEHKFQNLNVDDTNKLLKTLNKDYVSKESMSLADIYNVDVETFRSDKTKINKIGFK
jgi:hypothetical protein